MRKLFLALVSCIALVAFMSLSTTAMAAAVDPDCDGDPYNNDFAVNNFTLVTPDSDVEHTVSGAAGEGVACGTEIDGPLFPISDHVGEETLNDNANILNPPGLEINPTAGIPVNSYAGNAIINSATWAPLGLGAIIVPEVYTDLTVAPIGTPDQVETCAYEADQAVGDPNPGEIVACYRGTTDPAALVKGHNFSWQTLGPDGRYTLTIGRFYNDLIPHQPGIPFVLAGLTNIHEFVLCNNIGDPIEPGVGGQCGGSSDPWVQKNGDASAPDCNGGQGPEGIYTVTVTNRAGETTDESTSCAVWTNAPPETTITESEVYRHDFNQFVALFIPWAKFKSSEPNSTFECKLNVGDVEGEWEGCNNANEEDPEENVTTGATLLDFFIWYFGYPPTEVHDFYVRATDEAGSTDPTPAAVEGWEW